MRTRKSTLTEQQRAAHGIVSPLDTQNVNTILDDSAYSPAGNDYAVAPRTRTRRASEAIHGHKAAPEYPETPAPVLAPAAATASSSSSSSSSTSTSSTLSSAARITTTTTTAPPSSVEVICSHCKNGAIGTLKNSWIRMADEYFELTAPGSWTPSWGSKILQIQGDTESIAGLNHYSNFEVYACNNQNCISYSTDDQHLFVTCLPLQRKKYGRRQRFFKLRDIKLQCPDSDASVEPVIMEDRRQHQLSEPKAHSVASRREATMESLPLPSTRPASQAQDQKTSQEQHPQGHSPRERSQPYPAAPPRPHPMSSSDIQQYDEAYHSPHQRYREVPLSNGHQQSNGLPVGQACPVTQNQYAILMDANNRIQSQTNMNMAALDQQRRDVQKLQRQQENWSHDVQRIDAAISRFAEEFRIMQEVLDQTRAELRHRPIHAPAAVTSAPATSLDATTIELFARSLEQMRPKLGEIEDMKIQMQIMKERVARLDKSASAGLPPKPEPLAHSASSPQYVPAREAVGHGLARDVYHPVQPIPRVHTPGSRPEVRQESRPIPSSAPAPTGPSRDSPRSHNLLPHQQQHSQSHHQHQPRENNREQPHSRVYSHSNQHSQSSSHPHPNGHAHPHSHSNQPHQQAQPTSQHTSQAAHPLHRSQSAHSHSHLQPSTRQSMHGQAHTQATVVPAPQAPSSHHHTESTHIHNRPPPPTSQTQLHTHVQSHSQLSPQSGPREHVPLLPPMQSHERVGPPPQSTNHEQSQSQPHPPQLQAHGYGHVSSAEPLRRTESENSRSVGSQAAQASGWVTVNPSAKRGLSTGSEGRTEFPGHSHSPKRPKLATLEPRSESRESRSHGHFDRMEGDQSGMRGHAHNSYGESTPARFIAYQSTQEHPGEDRWRPDSHRTALPEHDMHAGFRRGGGRGRGRKSLPSEFNTPGHQWENIEGPGGPVGPFGYYNSVSPDTKSTALSVRRDSNGNVIPVAGHVSMDASRMQDPYAHTKKTRTKPVRNSDGILIRKDGRPDMRSQSSAANLRKVHARKEQERAEESVGDSPPSGLAYNTTHTPGSPSPMPASEGVDPHAHERHSQIMEKVFPNGHRGSSQGADRYFQQNGSPHKLTSVNGVKAEPSASETASPPRPIDAKSPARQLAEICEDEQDTSRNNASAKSAESSQEREQDKTVSGDGPLPVTPEKVSDEPPASLPTPIAEPMMSSEPLEVAASA
ncbi:hypothetical protein EJ05DRAFT_477817 [Pseudovirgaria hyperparasitica]|uniref:Uncharacterized protein n=1 Tax=Pseudovirgaria hyperparasitica TaxID=470096 RepID=A0A6A6W1D3_9PEZI|nr:uncharacterized protein EJ05DRAFT_477817 [Pseudovirgaria hyperparasitica]KAF2756728.1 hypothetical protein EJ05DRAFT_477817 [Pseudovirgaria hyperparasitica]